MRACAQISGVLLQEYACMCVCGQQTCEVLMRQTDKQTDSRLGQLAKNKANFTFQLGIKQLSIQAVTPESMAET